jgi:type IV pilus assembly protein PilM
MSFLKKITRLVKDPPPEFVFEISEAGIAFAHRNEQTQLGFEPLDPDVVSVSPQRDNVLQPERFAEHVRKLIPTNGQRNRHPAALILPDYCGRVAVLDFVSFPSDPQEQLALVRFRVKKSVPFDLESAAVSYSPQSRSGSKGLDVVVAMVSLEILARYEAPLRAANLHPGMVTTSTLATLNLLPSSGLAVTAKLSGRVLSIAVTVNNNLKLLRCVELSNVTADEILALLFPTFAYVEDEMHKRPEKLLLCGFGAMGEALAPQLAAELAAEVEPLRSRYGVPGAFNAGMLGYLQALEGA